MGEIVKPIGEWISQNIPLSVGIAVFIFCLLFEISKVKIYPLRWICKLITWPIRKIEEPRTSSLKQMVTDLRTDIDTKLQNISAATVDNLTQLEQRFDKLETRFDKLDEKQQETEERLDSLAAARIKNHVLNFARQCRKGEYHSHEDFANLFNENKIYQRLVKKYNWENDVYTHDFEFIQHMYDEHNKNNDFA